MDYLINHEAVINHNSEGYGTPLHQAVVYGRLDVVKYLLQNKADANLGRLKMVGHL